MRNIMIENASLGELFKEIEQIVTQVIKTTDSHTEKQSNNILTREETSKLLQVSFVTLHKWNKLEILPAFNIGTRVYYYQNDVTNAMKRVA